MRINVTMVLALAVGVLLASAMATAVDKNGTIEQLKQRLEETKKPKERVELAITIVERQYDAADKAYNDGNVDQGQKELADVEKYGVLAANEAASGHERMKQTEIALRKIEERLDNLARSVDIDYRAPVRDTLNKLEKARNALLLRMFK